MSPLELSLPRLRAELIARPRPGGGTVVTDPVSGRKVGLDVTGKRVYDALGRARTLTALIGSVGLETAVDAVAQRLAYFTRNAFFEGPRAERLRAAYSYAEARTDVRPVHELPLRTEPGLRHACQACGSCCSATDVGPLPDAVVQAIQAVDWSDELGGLSPFREVESAPGQVVRLMAMREDQCVFLDEDRLCRVHRRLGVEKKPVPCRQFPYVFTRVGDRIDVSLQMECRAFDRAQRAAGPAAESEPELRDLLRIGAPVHTVPNVLDFGDGLAMGRDELERIEDALVAAVRAAPLTPSGPVRALLEGVASVVASVEAPIEEAEASILRPREEPAVGPNGPLVGAFLADFSAFLVEAARVATERGLDHVARRYTSLASALSEVTTVFDRRVHRFEAPEVIAGLLADLAVAALRGKEPVRRGVPLRLGFAVLGLKLLLTAAGACARARAACRVHVVAQDLVDSMVLASKLSRDRAVLDFLEQDSARVLLLFARGQAIHATTPP